MTKICRRKDCVFAGLELELTSFHKRRNYCKDCENKDSRASRARRNKNKPVPTFAIGATPEPDFEIDWEVPDLAPPSIPDHAPIGFATPNALTIAVGDIHFPFHHRMATSWVLDRIAALQPAAVIQMGDLYDMYAHSKYPRSLNLMTPNQEMDAARAYGEWFWKQVQRLSPGSKCYQMGDDNHGHRANKRALEYYAAAERWIDDAIKEMMTFEGVSLVYGERNDLELNGVIYAHGWAKLGDHMKSYGKPTVVGHLHRGNVLYTPTIWEMCVGWLGNRESKVFSYQGKLRADKTTLGVGEIYPDGPRFVPYRD